MMFVFSSAILHSKLLMKVVNSSVWRDGGVNMEQVDGVRGGGGGGEKQGSGVCTNYSSEAQVTS